MEAVITLVFFIIFCIVIIAIGFLHLVIRGWDVFSDEYRKETARLRAGKSKQSTKSKSTTPEKTRSKWEVEKAGVLIKPIGIEPIRIYSVGQVAVSNHISATIASDTQGNLYIETIFASLEEMPVSKTQTVYKVRASSGAAISVAIQHLKEQVFTNPFFEEDVKELKSMEEELNHYNRYKKCINKVEKKYWFTLVEVDDAAPINTLTTDVTFPEAVETKGA